jgi:endogenous inhibitor of DNA gyrase (YacG/DUF329 family)
VAKTSDQIHCCSMCGNQVPPRPDNKAFPFCSPRCQLVDLGHWLDGDYSISEEAVDRDYGQRPDSES